MTAEMAEESRLRKQQWLKNGCNGFDMKDDFVFDIENKNDDNIVIDTRSDFNF